MRSVSFSSRKDRINRSSQPYSGGRQNRDRDTRSTSNSNSNGNGNNANGSRRVYVGNLSWEVSWQDLKDHMRSAGGQVVRADVLQGEDGRSKGCGLVEFAAPREARAAIDALHDSLLKGRKIFVREDREDSFSAPSNHNNSSSSNSHNNNRTSNASPSGVVVENLPSNYAWKELKDVFKGAGFVVRADIITNTSTGSIGVVDFKSHADAKNAVAQFNNSSLGGNVLSVRLRGTENDGNDMSDNDDDSNFGGNQDAHNSNNGNNKLYVGQLAWSVTWQNLKDHFKTVGTVLRADVATEGDSGRSKGFGTVEFASADDAKRAIEELNNSTLEGRKIFVREDREAR